MPKKEKKEEVKDLPKAIKKPKKIILLKVKS